LRSKINTRRNEFEALKQRLAQGSRGKPAPELAKAARELTDHQALTNLLEGDVGNAEQAVRDALASFGEAVGVHSREWDTYLYEAGAAAVQAPVGYIGDLPGWLGELWLIDALLAREGVLHDQPSGPEGFQNRFDRSQRQVSINRILGGEDRGSEGVQYGILGLVAEYAARFTKPQPPKPEPEIEVEPLAVRLHRQARGLAPAGPPADPFLRSD
jgi:hypothetical protein